MAALLQYTYPTDKSFAILGGILAICLLCLISQIIYNIYFHPLSRFPGPKLWTSLRFTYIRHILAGTLAREIRVLHCKYGDVVRVAPDELSFATPEALQDIYANTPGRPAFPKGPFWNGTIKGQPFMVLNALNQSDHTRMRKNVASALTEKAIRAQEGIIELYATKLICCLEQLVSKNENGAVLDITRWLNFTAFDLIGEIGFGESFNCLERNEFHPWAFNILATFKAVACAVSLRYYPYLDWPLRLTIPKSVWEIQKHHFQLAVDKLQRRLGLEKQRQRPDVIGMLKLDEQGREGLTIRELHAHAPLIIIAGSQTIVTVLSGILNFLVKDPGKLAILTNEVRNIQSESEMTQASIKNLEYLNAVINEGLRLCMPAAGGLNRLTPPAGGIVSGHQLPGNIHVNVQPLSIHLSPIYFHHPASFIPERWLSAAIADPKSPYHNDRRNAVLPFSMGPRSCPAKALAWAEIRLFLARLVWKFDFEEVDSVKGRLRWEDQKVYIAVERKPFEIRLKARNSSAGETLCGEGYI